MKIYSRRHPLNAMNIQKSERSPRQQSQKEWDQEFVSSPIRVITTVKPDRAPARMLTDTCDGIHPRHQETYIRKTMPLDKINVQRLLGVIKKFLDAANLEATKL